MESGLGGRPGLVAGMAWGLSLSQGEASVPYVVAVRAWNFCGTFATFINRTQGGPEPTHRTTLGVPSSGARRTPGHAHACYVCLEVSHHGRRLILDTGSLT